MAATHYDTLGVEPDATREQIVRAYRRFARTHHPDMADQRAAAEFHAGTNAYQVLTDPEQRAAYDNSLLTPAPANAVEADEPVDSWGEQGEWADEPIDAAVVDEPTPTPTPTPTTPPTVQAPQGTSGGKEAAPAAAGALSTNPVVYDELPNPLVVIGAGIALGALGSLLPSNHPSGELVVSAAVIATIATTALTCWLLKDRYRRLPTQPVHQPLRRTIPAVASLIVIAAISVSATKIATHQPNMWVVPWLVVGVTAGVSAGYSITVWLADHRLVKKKDLRECWCFGSTAPGLEPALLNRLLATAQTKAPGARVLRVSQPQAFFSHAIIVGKEAVLIRGINTGAGNYEWSGASLLRESRGQLADVFRGDYQLAVQSFQTVMKGITVTPVLAVNDQGLPAGVVTSSDGQGPPVIPMSDLPSFLLTRFSQPQTDVCRTAVCATYRAMSQQLTRGI